MAAKKRKPVRGKTPKRKTVARKKIVPQARKRKVQKPRSREPKKVRKPARKPAKAPAKKQDRKTAAKPKKAIARKQSKARPRPKPKAPARKQPAVKRVTAKKTPAKKTIGAKKPAWVKARERRRKEREAQERFEIEERIAIQVEGRKRDFEEASNAKSRAEINDVKRVMKEKGVEWIRKDLSVAKTPNMLRHIPGSEGMLVDLENAADGKTGEQTYAEIAAFAKERGISFKEAWRMARESGDAPFSVKFHDTATRIAQMLGVAIKEVYTLYFSP